MSGVLEAGTLPCSGPVARRRGWQAGMLLVTWLVAAWLLFFQLGHYALWDDEAFGALGARSLLATGDTGAMIGHNVVAYRDGLVLNGLRIEGEAPLMPYLVALSFRFFGENAFAARLPAALFGLATVTLMLAWLWRERVRTLSVFLFCAALLGNVSFFLYARNCRYYAVSMACFTAVAWVHLHRRGRGELWLAGLCGAVLLLANYVLFVVLCLCLLVDTILWQQRRRPYGWRDLVAAGILPMLAAGVAWLWWNPLRTGLGERLVKDGLWDKIRLFYWHWRDLNHSEMIVGPLLLITAILAFWPRYVWFRRGMVAVAVYAVALTVFSIQTVTLSLKSDVRYFAALLPLLIALQAFTVSELARIAGGREAFAVVAVGVVAFWTNLFHGGLLRDEIPRSTPLAFVKELRSRLPDPYTAAAAWINEHVKEGQSIFVQPDYMAYPLMFHAPKAVYAWQFEANRRGDYPTLPEIHFKGLGSPDYIMLFGPERKPEERVWDPSVYWQGTMLPIYWHDEYRPEIHWRSFEPKPLTGHAEEGIRIKRRAGLPD